jgi:hypothetical protein
VSDTDISEVCSSALLIDLTIDINGTIPMLLVNSIKTTTLPILANVVVPDKLGPGYVVTVVAPYPRLSAAVSTSVRDDA